MHIDINHCSKLHIMNHYSALYTHTFVLHQRELKNSLHRRYYQDIEFYSAVNFLCAIYFTFWQAMLTRTADQDWVVTGLGTPQGNKGQVSIYIWNASVTAAPGCFKGMAAAQRMQISQHLHSWQTWGSRKNGPAAQEHQPGTELKDTGRNCDERHMMVSGNLKRPEHQSTMNNVYQHL